MKKTLLSITAIGLLATGCIKIETTKIDNTGGSGGSTALSDTEKKIVGKWRTTYSKLFSYDNGMLVISYDALLAMDSCKRDNLGDFREDRTVYIDVNSLKCYPTESQTYLGGTWQLIAGNPNKIIIADTTASGGMGSISPLTITELTPNRMKLYRDSTVVVDGHTLSSKTFVVFER